MFSTGTVNMATICVEDLIGYKHKRSFNNHNACEKKGKRSILPFGDNDTTSATASSNIKF